MWLPNLGTEAEGSRAALRCQDVCRPAVLVYPLLPLLRPAPTLPGGPGRTQGIHRERDSAEQLRGGTPPHSRDQQHGGPQVRDDGGRGRVATGGRRVDPDAPSFSPWSPSTQSPEARCGASLTLQGTWPSLLSPGCMVAPAHGARRPLEADTEAFKIGYLMPTVYVTSAVEAPGPCLDSAG
ncbi:uncharacterized protein LOC115286452 isoform X2 [Suricata suricatta]|uniref:uncharacterized protein LOC115286452 isoform X2 n=1 Tax=Suricata suricatta TaxID=37032 RepID=UPI0011553A84|nr:uncharacterized protein LOC115286452 isoform X2 [Suricata suricatta]